MKQPITAEQRAAIERATRKARVLYEGVLTPHRSCGICLAETFNRPTPAYQSLRRGGITGVGHCGAIKAGELILGEIFGDPDPTGAVTDRLRVAVVDYQQRVQTALSEPASVICNDLTAPFGDFYSPERHGFCTGLSETVARCIAETIVLHGGTLDTTPIAGVDDTSVDTADE